VKKIKTSSKIDVQFLPEGGHIIDNVITTMGVIAKDSLGNGVGNLEGKILDDKNIEISSFSLNSLGTGRYSFLPKLNTKYRAEIVYKGKKHTYLINKRIELKGVNLKITKIKDDIILSLITNETTLKDIKNKEFTVANFNSSNLGNFKFKFTTKETITKRIAAKNLLPGTNIFTLFNEENMPIAERLFFNYNGISILKSSKPYNIVDSSDSISLTINYKNLKASSFNNVSISVLPASTKSYAKNSNIISQTLLQPYLKGRIENGYYYFKNITERKKYDLDNLLLTQGWSSYHWDELFTNKTPIKYTFENGIDLKINIADNKKGAKLLIHNTTERQAEIIDIKEGINSFNSMKYFPKEEEVLHISRVTKKGKLTPSTLYLQYAPNHFTKPDIKTNSLLKKPFYYSSEDYIDEKLATSSLKNTQKLKEIVLKVDLEKERIEKIKNSSFGQVYFMNKKNSYRYFNVFDFLSTKGFFAERIPFTNEVIISNRISTSLLGGNTPVIFLDGQQLADFTQLTWLDMSIIDYIEIDKLGTGGGVRGGNGIIRIVTNPFKMSKRRAKTTQQFKFPVTFSNSKKFYRPVYENYDSQFYKSFGTIDWLPTNKIDKNGNLNFKFHNNQPNNIRVFIEGITTDGEFILEEKFIEVEK
ncbi:MAG: hypothetical protein AB8B78_13065, partial [Polaribacter sp.]